jgi:hypothetical protein
VSLFAKIAPPALFFPLNGVSLNSSPRPPRKITRVLRTPLALLLIAYEEFLKSIPSSKVEHTGSHKNSQTEIENFFVGY